MVQCGLDRLQYVHNISYGSGGNYCNVVSSGMVLLSTVTHQANTLITVKGLLHPYISTYAFHLPKLHELYM